MIENIVALIPAYCPDKEMTALMSKLTKEFAHIVVVDDGCYEKYKEVFDEACSYENVALLHHDVNKGKGMALKTGFAHILEKLPDAQGVVTLDADGQHTVEDTIKCCEAFLNSDGKKPVVFGCRDFSSDSDIPPRSRFGNRLTSRLMKFFCDITLSDTQTGLRVLSTDILKDLLEVPGERYEYEMNMIFALHDLEVPFKEVQITIIYLNQNEGSHFNPIKDSMKIYKVFMKFCISSFGSALLDWLIFTAAQHFLKVPLPSNYVEVSTAIARICSGLFNYNFNRIIFKSKAKDALVSGPKYLVLWLVQMVISAYSVKYVAMWTGFPSPVVKIVIDTILFFISYKIQQMWVFKKNKDKD